MQGLAFLTVAVLASCVGCASYGSHLSASPLHPGASEMSFNADGMVVDRGLGPQPLPNPEFGLRFGATRHFDYGGRVNLGSVEVDGRLRFVETSAVDLALVAGAGAGFVPVTNTDTGLCNANLLGSLLASVKLGALDQLVLGPRVISTYAFPLTAFQGDATGAGFIHYVGGVLGARLPVGSRSYLSPEINVFGPYDTTRDEWFYPTVQGGLALTIVSSRPRSVGDEPER